MARTTSVNLRDHFADFVEKQAASGRYRSADEVVEAGLRLLERDEMKLETLRKAIEEGEASGFVRDFDFGEIRDKIDRLDEESIKAAE